MNQKAIHTFYLWIHVSWVKKAPYGLKLILNRYPSDDVTGTNIQCEAVLDYEVVFYFPNQILGCRQLITVYFRANGRIHSAIFFVRISVMVQMTRRKPPATAEGSQPVQFHSSCTLTLILPKNRASGYKCGQQ